MVVEDSRTSANRRFGWAYVPAAFLLVADGPSGTPNRVIVDTEEEPAGPADQQQSSASMTSSRGLGQAGQ